MEKSRAEELMLEKLAEGINSTSKLTHALLEEIKDSEADFAVIKTELAVLRENVKSLSEIVREGNGATSLLTKIALIEQKISDLHKWIDNHADSHYRIKNEISDLKKQLTELEHNYSHLNEDLSEIKQKISENDEEDRKSIHEAIEWNKIKEKSALSIKEANHNAAIKIISGVIIAVLTVVAAWYVKNMSEKETNNPKEDIHQKDSPANPPSSPHNLGITSSSANPEHIPPEN